MACAGLRVLGVPLRKGKYRGQIKLDGVVHAYNGGWGPKAHTRCGIWYTHVKDHRELPYATRTARLPDCMACVAAGSS